MLLMNTDVNSAARIAESMTRSVQALQIPHPYSDCAEVITVSAGVAGGIPAKDHSADALIAAADKALYEAKLRGRNRVFAHTSMQPLVSS